MQQMVDLVKVSMENQNINNYLKKIFFIYCFVFSLNTQAEDVVCLPEKININEGDVISAEVLNEILTRINNFQVGLLLQIS